MSIPFYRDINSQLKKDYIYSYELTQLLESIREWYQEYQSIPKLRKAMKEAGYFTPFMELDIYDSQVIIRKFARKIRIDDVVGYTNYSSLELGRWITRTSSPDFIPTYQRSPEHAIAQTYEDETTAYIHTLFDWIERGNICECGNHFIDRNGTGECIVCEQLNAPMSYSTRAEDILGHETTKEIKFGIELEYENVKAKQVKQSIGDHAIPKLDGTIRNGVEVVTRPACIKTHKEVLKKFFDAVKTEAHS